MTEDSEKKAKKGRIPMEEWIEKMKLLFYNAKSENVLPEFEKIGYTEERIDGFISKLETLEQLYQLQIGKYSNQYKETEKFDLKRNEIDTLYRRHLAFCKVLFKGNTQANASLELSQPKKKAYAGWYQQVLNFYVQILSNESFKEKMATLNIKEEDLNAQKAALLELSALKNSQKREVGEAQKTTEKRDEAFKELYPDYADLVAYAKIIFAGNQVLEQLGIVVKR